MRPIDGTEPEAMPRTIPRLLVDVFDDMPVDFDEGLMRKLATGLGISRLGHLANRECMRLKLLKGVVQLLLGGTFDQIETVQDEIGKGQRTLAGEGRFVAAMAFEELG